MQTRWHLNPSVMASFSNTTSLKVQWIHKVPMERSRSLRHQYTKIFTEARTSSNLSASRTNWGKLLAASQTSLNEGEGGQTLSVGRTWHAALNMNSNLLTTERATYSEYEQQSTHNRNSNLLLIRTTIYSQQKQQPTLNMNNNLLTTETATYSEYEHQYTLKTNSKLLSIETAN